MKAADLDKHILVRPGDPAKLGKRDCDSARLFPDRDDAEKRAKENAKAIDDLQNALWAERRRALLVVLQGIDTAGKDGTVKGVFNECGPLGVAVRAFGRPSEEELAHNFLWRVHAVVPKKGMIGVFNRSHYEDVLVVKVRALAPSEEVERRYDQINAFEKHLSENGVTILKFMLHISKDEQKERLQERLDRPEKHWKFNPGDLEDRALWDQYQDAYDVMLTRCSTEHAPWRVVPADKKWRRNAIVSEIVRAKLEEMDPRYPPADFDPKAIKIS